MDRMVSGVASRQQEAANLARQAPAGPEPRPAAKAVGLKKLIGKRICYKFFLESGWSWVGCLVMALRGTSHIKVCVDDGDKQVVKVLESTRAPSTNARDDAEAYCWQCVQRFRSPLLTLNLRTTPSLLSP
jgi:hypothetical protein